jgi:excisionase family DNA binding protein
MGPLAVFAAKSRTVLEDSAGVVPFSRGSLGGDGLLILIAFNSFALRLFRLRVTLGLEVSIMLHQPVALPESEEAQVRELHRMLQLGSPALVGANGERLELPEAVFRLLKDIVRNMQHGRAIVLVPENQQLTTQRAADLLGVSRPHLIKLLETGDLPYHKVGSHRRVYLKDLVAYQKRRDLERKAALNRIAKEAFESGLYDRTGIPEGGEDE